MKSRVQVVAQAAAPAAAQAVVPAAVRAAVQAVPAQARLLPLQMPPINLPHSQVPTHPPAVQAVQEAVPAVQAAIEGKTVVKEIYVKGKIINIVVK